MSRFAILLTTCVKPKYCNKSEIRQRKELYLRSIKCWLKNTKLDIYLVDSSNYDFHEINHKRFHMFSFKNRGNNDPHLGKSRGEVNSILKAYDYFKDEWVNKGYKYMVKITGKYYLKGLEDWLSSNNKRIDLWIQHQRRLSVIESIGSIVYNMVNTEIFICKLDKIVEIFKTKYSGNLIVERHMNLIIESGRYKVSRLPPFKNVLKSKQANTGKILKYL